MWAKTECDTTEVPPFNSVTEVPPLRTCRIRLHQRAPPRNERSVCEGGGWAAVDTRWVLGLQAHSALCCRNLRRTRPLRPVSVEGATWGESKGVGGAWVGESKWTKLEKLAE